MNTKYFYTTIKSTADEKLVNGNQSFKKKKTLLESAFGTDDSQNNMVKATKIICMNYTESKYYIYSENGILLNRVNFENNVKQYGDPIATSHDGLKYIFMKKNKHEITVMLLTEKGFEF